MTTADAPARRRRRFGSVWITIALAAALTAIIVAFVGQPSSGSMSPTLEPGDRLIVNRLAFLGSDPGPGDIVVFRPDESWGDKPVAEDWLSGALQWVGETTGIRPYVLVKRVIAGPGQTVECCDAEGRVLVDGEPLAEPYVVNDLPFVPGSLDCGSSPTSNRCFETVTVPENSYLVLGDNRGNSADSAAACRGRSAVAEGCWRWMRRADVVGEIGVVFWPVSRWGAP